MTEVKLTCGSVSPLFQDDPCNVRLSYSWRLLDVNQSYWTRQATNYLNNFFLAMRFLVLCPFKQQELKNERWHITDRLYCKWVTWESMTSSKCQPRSHSRALTKRKKWPGHIKRSWIVKALTEIWYRYKNCSWQGDNLLTTPLQWKYAVTQNRKLRSARFCVCQVAMNLIIMCSIFECRLERT